MKKLLCLLLGLFCFVSGIKAAPAQLLVDTSNFRVVWPTNFWDANRPLILGSLSNVLATNFTVATTNYYWTNSPGTNTISFTSPGGPTGLNSNAFWYATGGPLSTGYYSNNAAGAARRIAYYAPASNAWILATGTGAAQLIGLNGANVFGAYKTNAGGLTYSTAYVTPVTNAVTNIYAAPVFRNGNISMASDTNVFPRNDGTVWVARDTNAPGIRFLGTTNGTWIPTYDISPYTNVVTDAIAYGVLGDGVKFYNTATVSNGYVTATNANFRPSDVGKLFVSYLDSTNLSFITATIASYVSPTNVQLAATYTAPAFESWYGTDNSIPMSNALASITGDGVLQLGEGNYLFGRNYFEPNSAKGVVVNLPSTRNVLTTNLSRQITIRGQTPAIIYPQFVLGANTLGYPNTGTILFNFAKPIAGITNTFFMHDATGYSVQFGWERYRFENLCLRQPPNPTHHGVWLARGGTTSFKDIAIDVDMPPGFLDASSGEPKFYTSNMINSPSTCISAIWGPDFYNYAGIYLENVTLGYHGLGLRSGEHTVGSGVISFVACGTGQFLDGAVGAGGTTTGCTMDSAFFYLCNNPMLVGTASTVREPAVYAHLKFETGFPEVKTTNNIVDPFKRLYLFAGMVSGTDPNVVFESTNTIYYNSIDNTYHMRGTVIGSDGVLTAPAVTTTTLTAPVISNLVAGTNTYVIYDTNNFLFTGNGGGQSDNIFSWNSTLNYYTNTANARIVTNETSSGIAYWVHRTAAGNATVVCSNRGPIISWPSRWLTGSAAGGLSVPMVPMVRTNALLLTSPSVIICLESNGQLIARSTVAYGRFGYTEQATNNTTQLGVTNEISTYTIAAGFPGAKFAVGTGSETKPGFAFTPSYDAAGNGLPIYLALSTKKTIGDATARDMSISIDPTTMQARIAAGTAFDANAGGLNIVFDTDNQTVGSIDLEINTNGFTRAIRSGGFMAQVHVYEPISTPPTFTDTGSVTNRVIEWWSNAIPPVKFFSIYYANNTSTPKTTNAPNPLPGP